MLRLRIARTALACVSLAMAPAIDGSAASGSAAMEASKGERLRLRVATFDPLEATPPLRPALKYRTDPESGYFILQFRDQVRREALARLRGLGVEPLQFLPDRAYLVRVQPGARRALLGDPMVRWLGAVQPGWKIAPELGHRAFIDRSRRESERMLVTLDLFPDEAPRAIHRKLVELGIEVLQLDAFSDTRRFRVRASRKQVDRAAAIPGVAWIEEVGEIRLRNDEASWVIQSDTLDERPIWDRGLHGEGEVIGHIDDELDIESCFFRDPDDNVPGPDHRKVVAYRSSTGFAQADHGTHTAGIAAGDRDPTSGTRAGNGQAWAARLSHAVLNDITGSGTTESNLYEYLNAAHADGARLHTNSWGDEVATAYTTWSRDIDLFSWDHEDSLVLFAVTNNYFLRTPENAKNVLAVGATWNGDQRDMFCSGGLGPTSDGRRKPEIYAPGCGIASAMAREPCEVVVGGGTSMATPAVAAAGALVRQYYREGWHEDGIGQPEKSRPPSGALIRATLINGTVDMTSIPDYPNDKEGWGRLLLDDALFFSGDERRLQLLADIPNGSGLTTGDINSSSVIVESSEQALRITLAFTEPPAALMAAEATINDLDLLATSPSGTLYRGNWFDVESGVSIPAGDADPINNLEMVLVDVPEVGEWTVSVAGTAVNQDRQGYALVATGRLGFGMTGPLNYDGHSVVEEIGNGNGIVDPGETITLPVSLLNLRDEPVTSVSARLSPVLPDRAQVTLDEQSFPDIDAGAIGGSNAPHYRLTVAPDVPCGEALPFLVEARHADGASSSTFVITAGQPPTEYPAEDTPLEIPAFSAAPTESAIDVSHSFVVGEVDVQVEIAHGAPEEAIVELTSPAGTTVRLHDRSGAGASGISAVFDDERQPDGPGSMGWFVGEQAQGVWTLGVSDKTIGGFPPTPGGSIEAWTLTFGLAGGDSCPAFECVGDPVPAEVEPTFTVEVAGATDLELAWLAVPGASGYRIWRSPRADFAEARLVGETAGLSLVLPGARSDPAPGYYRIHAINSCNWQGP